MVILLQDIEPESKFCGKSSEFISSELTNYLSCQITYLELDNFTIQLG